MNLVNAISYDVVISYNMPIVANYKSSAVLFDGPLSVLALSVDELRGSEEGFDWDTDVVAGNEKSPALEIPFAFTFATQLLMVARAGAMEVS